MAYHTMVSGCHFLHCRPSAQIGFSDKEDTLVLANIYSNKDWAGNYHRKVFLFIETPGDTGHTGTVRDRTFNGSGLRLCRMGDGLMAVLVR
jgi:hypothetical protein